MPFLALSRLARTRVTVALCGQGADEPFSGYPRHIGEQLGGAYRALPAPLRTGLIRPLTLYTGPEPRAYIPIDTR